VNDGEDMDGLRLHVINGHSSLEVGQDLRFRFRPGNESGRVAVTLIESGFNKTLFFIRQLTRVKPAVAGEFVELGLDFRAVFRAQLGQFCENMRFAHEQNLPANGDAGKQEPQREFR